MILLFIPSTKVDGNDLVLYLLPLILVNGLKTNQAKGL